MFCFQAMDKLNKSMPMKLFQFQYSKWVKQAGIQNSRIIGHLHVDVVVDQSRFVNPFSMCTYRMYLKKNMKVSISVYSIIEWFVNANTSDMRNMFWLACGTLVHNTNSRIMIFDQKKWYWYWRWPKPELSLLGQHGKNQKQCIFCWKILIWHLKIPQTSICTVWSPSICNQDLNEACYNPQGPFLECFRSVL